MNIIAWRGFQIFILGLLGFVLATFGISLGADSGLFKKITTSAKQNAIDVILNSQSNNVAQACVSPEETEAEIFFLSCGGIF